MSWDPNRYLQYEEPRLRPALELLARIPLAAPATIADLGCGAGNVAQRLARRWPHAAITGVDGDEAMLAKARAAMGEDARHRFIHADLAAWRADVPFDLVFSNAALHWLDSHDVLFPRLLHAVAPGGALAVQMPDNFAAASHRIVDEVATSVRWRAMLASRVRSLPVAPPAAYHAWLAPHASSIDIWTTEYLQHLPARSDGEHPVLAWLRGTTLLPFMAMLDDAGRRDYARELAGRLETAYPRRADGSVLFPFRRLFIVAQR